MDLEARYQVVLQELAKGARGLQRYSPEEVAQLREALQTSVSLTPTLCLVTHAAYPERSFEPILLELMQKPLSSSEMVYVLNAARKHIMQARFKEGLRLDLDFLERLRSLLRNSDPEVIEWTLRTVEECGSQGVLLSKDVAAVRPKVFSLWRAQNRTILELVTLLQRRWNPTHDQKR